MSCSFSPAVVALLATLALVLVLHAEGAEGKRGCAFYGHSCYGGVGKRGSEVLPSNDIPNQLREDDDNPEIVFTGPRSEYREPKLSPRQLYSVSPLLRQWLQAFRKVQDVHDDRI